MNATYPRIYFASLMLWALVATAPVFAVDKNLSTYYSLKSSDPAAAQQVLSDYLTENPNDALAQTEMGYVLIGEKKYRDAVVHLEKAHALEPANENITLQLAYAYKSLGEMGHARVQFQELCKSTSTELAENACQAITDMASRRFQFIPAPFFADAYINPVYMARFNDKLLYSQVRAGAAFGTNIQTEVYGSFRYNDDSESIGGQVPDIISDNAAIYSVGARVYPTKKIPLSIYGEAGTARDLNDRNRDEWREDYRAGVDYFKSWVPKAKCSPEWKFPFKRASSLYADASVYSRYDHNWIGYLQWREGLRVIEKSRMAADAFLYLGGALDSNNVYYNNLAEIGAGATLSPDQAWPFFLRYTAVKGSYINVGSTIPTKQDYTDHRWELVGYLRF